MSTTTKSKPKARKKPTRKAKTVVRKLEPTAELPTPASMKKLSEHDADRLRQVLNELVECVYERGFPTRNAERRFMTVEVTDDYAVIPGKSEDDLRVLRPRLGASPEKNLTAAQERSMFLQYNYARYRKMRILKQFHNKRLTLKAARELLKWDDVSIRTRNMIIQANLGLVPAMLERARIVGMDFGELISEGHLALIRSVDKFDCLRGFKFSTYACRAILTSFSRIVTKNARYRSQFPTEYDPALQKSDIVEQKRADDEAYYIGHLQGVLGENSAELNQIERQVIEERFGLEGDPEIRGKTLREVAQDIGVTKERIRQIQGKALAKLASAMRQRVTAA